MSRNVLYLLLVAAAFAPCASSATTQLICGGRSIGIFNSNIPESPFFVLDVGGVDHIPFSMENEYFAVRCEKDLKGRDRLLILHSCGGSGCADQANFGIVDPRTGKILLRPNARHRGNWNKAVAVLGKKFKPFECDTHSKTSVTESQNGGDYCFVSPLVLN